MELLLRNERDVNATHSIRVTNGDLVECLCENGADVEGVSDHSETARFFAAAYGKLEGGSVPDVRTNCECPKYDLIRIYPLRALSPSTNKSSSVYSASERFVQREASPVCGRIERKCAASV